MARPSTYSRERADIILERVALGGPRSALAHVLTDDDALPCITTWFKWLRDNAELAQAYTRACEARAEVKAAEIEAIADTPEEGEVVTVTPDGTTVKTGDMIEHRKLRIETRKWVAAKLNPKRYTERQHIEHSGELNVTLGTDDELVAELLHLAATGRLKLPGVELVELDAVTDTPSEDEDDFSDIA